MIIVDTNVLIQPPREDGEQRVVDWLDANDGQICRPAQAIAELVYGYERLEHGRSRTELRDSIFALLTRYRDRMLPIDRAAAEAHGRLYGRLQKDGRTLPFADSQIAAIAISRGAKIATRNTASFDRTGVQLIDPWTA